MNDQNSLVIQGNLTRNPELKQVSEKARVVTFGIANHRYWPAERNEEGEPTKWNSKTSFLEAEAWNFQADRAFTELATGDRVKMVCRVEADQWLNDDGEKRSKTKLVVSHFEKIVKADPDNQQVDEYVG
jgi:single-strand DNA-binding protein